MVAKRVSAARCALGRGSAACCISQPNMIGTRDSGMVHSSCSAAQGDDFAFLLPQLCWHVLPRVDRNVDG